jgi:hypothetical protein
MAHILQGRSALELIYTELPPLAIALLVAETFFKFGSFSLEAIAFLTLWYAMSVPYAKLVSAASRSKKEGR